MGRRGLIVAAVLLSGCGPTPPQAPGPQAHQLNMALSSISGACGNASAIQAFNSDPRALAKTERQAAAQVPVLVRVYKQNPAWIFQGQTVADLVQMSETFLEECGLHRAAARLRAAT